MGAAMLEEELRGAGAYVDEDAAHDSTLVDDVV